MDKETLPLFTIFPDSPPPHSYGDRVYVFTNGFLRQEVNSNILLEFLLCRMDGYSLHSDAEKCELNIVQEGYRKYLVRLNGSHTNVGCIEYEYPTYRNAYIQFAELTNNYPDRLVELIAYSWDGKVIEHQWYKKFTYSTGRKRIVPKKIKQGLHPYLMYM